MACSPNDLKFAEYPIEITHIENPHLFWFKHSKVSNESLNKLQKDLLEFASRYNRSEWNEAQIKIGQMIVMSVDEWRIFVRGQVENIKGSVAEIWCLDHACVVKARINSDVIPLDDDHLVNFPITNVHIGGLSGVVPADIVSFSFSKVNSLTILFFLQI